MGSSIDMDNGKKDRLGQGCAEYIYNVNMCGKLDDIDFVASKLCCACMGRCLEIFVHVSQYNFNI